MLTPRRLLSILLLPLALPLLALILVQLAPVQQQLLTWSQHTLQKNGIHLQMVGLQGYLPIAFSLEHLTIADTQGIWLEFKDFRFAWQPWELLRGRIHLEELSLGELILKRMPLPRQTKKLPSRPFNLQFLTSWPVIVVDKIMLPSIMLGSAVLGEKMVLSLMGNIITHPATGMHAQLQLQRQDQNNAQIAITAHLNMAQMLDVQLNAADHGGLVKRVTKLPLTGPVTLQLKGQGPLLQWTGALQCHLPGIVQLATSFHVTHTKNLSLTGTITPDTALIKPKFSALLGTLLPFNLGMQVSDTQPQINTQLNIATPVAQLQAQSTIDLTTQRLALEMGVGITDLAKLQPLFTQPITGSAQITLHGAGTWRQPKLLLTLHGKEINANHWHVPELMTTAQLVWLNQKFSDMQLEINGHLNELQNNDTLITDKVIWQGKIHLPTNAAITMPHFAITAGNAQINLSGAFTPTTKDGTFNLSAAIPDLTPWAKLAKINLNGGLFLNTKSNIVNATEVDTHLTLQANNMNGLPLALAELLGPNSAVTAHAHLNAQHQLRLDNLRYTGKALTLALDGTIPLADGQLSLLSKLTIPRLAVLNHNKTIPLAGKVNANLLLTGSLLEPHAQLELIGQQLQYGQRNLQDLQVKLNAQQLMHNPNGNLDIRLGPMAHTISLSANFARQQEKFAVYDLVLNAPATQLRGALEVNVRDFLCQGSLTGQVKDLGALNYWTAQKYLHGALEVSADLIALQTQQLRLRLHGTALTVNGGRIDELTTNLAVTDARTLAGIDLRIAAHGIVHGAALRLNTALINAKGNAHQLDITANLKAESPKNTFLNLDAQLTQDEPARSMLLRNLTGTWLGKPFTIKTTPQLMVNAHEIRLTPLALDLAGAHLNITARMDAQQVNAAITLDALPLRLLSDLQVINWEGNGIANAKLQLTGANNDPIIKFNLAANNLQVPGIAAPAAQVSAQAELNAGKLSTALTINGLTDQPTHMQLTVPMNLTLNPVNFHFADRAPLDGSLTGEINLARLSQFFSLGEQKLAGILKAAVRVNGSLQQPILGGNLQITQGRYENGIIGTIINDLNLDLQLAGQALTISKLTARDGAKGQINAHGTLAVDYQKQAWHFDSNINLHQATLVRSDLAVATINGALALTGNQQGAKTTGTLDIIKATVNIPEWVAPAVPKLEVREIPKRKQNKESVPSNDLFYPVDLDIKVEIPTRSFMRGRGLDSEWRGHIDIVGTAQQPQITGQLRIQRGLFDFLDRRFNIQEGTIDFHGDYPPKPNINLQADASGRDMLAILTVTGLATNPKLTLASQPTLPQDEVLARLLFDRESKDISVLQALKLAAAVRTLAGGGTVGVDLFGKTRDSLGLDNLSMEGTDANKSVKAGKYLRDNVYLEVESGIGSNASTVRVEKEISRQLSIETAVDQNSSSTFGINWKIDY